MFGASAESIPDRLLVDLRSDRLAAVRRLGKPESSYRKVTFHKEHLEMDQHIDAVLIGPGHPLYAALDERLNEMLVLLTTGVGVFVDTNSDAPYKLHFFEMAVKGQNTKGEVQTLLGEMVAVREELSSTEERLSVIPADTLLDLPAHPAAPENLQPEDATGAADFLKSTYQTLRRGECQKERQHFVQVCRDYLQQSFEARIRAAQDRVMGLRARESRDPDIAIARQRAENDLADWNGRAPNASQVSSASRWRSMGQFATLPLRWYSQARARSRSRLVALSMT